MSGNPKKLPGGLTPLRHQKISDKESSYFPIPGKTQERERIIGQEQDFFQPEAERVRSYDPELVGPTKRKKPQKEFERLHENISRLQEVNTLQTKAIHTLQEDYAQLSKASEETKRRLNQVLEEQNYCKRDREYLHKDIKIFFNVFQNIKPPKQGNVLDNPYHQKEMKPDAFLENKPRSPSQYQDGYNITYAEKEALKKLPEASSCPNFSGVGEYDHMELIDYIDGLFIDVPSITDYPMTAR
ncbi:hypothetical protein O181_090952 [Austropuccinia psidii MF-1]|uniref:Uncharacterized protein n=1 Tax=Austropuccinia psidii MF-1 TaxID=1389203 RepID=A0A9Q3IWJ4_9BASI|nr:hypothetical protein [Austropuccinia psidii MF-1]